MEHNVFFAFRNLIEHIAEEPRNRDITNRRKQLFKDDVDFQYDSFYVKGVVEEV